MAIGSNGEYPRRVFWLSIIWIFTNIGTCSYHFGIDFSLVKGIRDMHTDCQFICQAVLIINRKLFSRNFKGNIAITDIGRCRPGVCRTPGDSSKTARWGKIYAFNVVL